jgi:hypothetical protein
MVNDHNSQLLDELRAARHEISSVAPKILDAVGRSAEAVENYMLAGHIAIALKTAAMDRANLVALYEILMGRYLAAVMNAYGLKPMSGEDATLFMHRMGDLMDKGGAVP